jgi:hypothetical protein
MILDLFFDFAPVFKRRRGCSTVLALATIGPEWLVAVEAFGTTQASLDGSRDYSLDDGKVGHLVILFISGLGLPPDILRESIIG